MVGYIKDTKVSLSIVPVNSIVASGNMFHFSSTGLLAKRGRGET